MIERKKVTILITGVGDTVGQGLIKAARQIVAPCRIVGIDRDEFSVEQMMAFLFEKIVAANGSVALSEVLPAITSRRGLITAFLALLELTRLHAIHLKQDKAFGEITARANPNYELSKSFSPA